MSAVVSVDGNATIAGYEDVQRAAILRATKIGQQQAAVQQNPHLDCSTLALCDAIGRKIT